MHSQLKTAQSLESRILPQRKDPLLGSLWAASVPEPCKSHSHKLGIIKIMVMLGGMGVLN